MTCAITNNLYEQQYWPKCFFPNQLKKTNLCPINKSKDWKNCIAISVLPTISKVYWKRKFWFLPWYFLPLSFCFSEDVQRSVCSDASCGELEESRRQGWKCWSNNNESFKRFDCLSHAFFLVTCQTDNKRLTQVTVLGTGWI